MNRSEMIIHALLQLKIVEIGSQAFIVSNDLLNQKPEDFALNTLGLPADEFLGIITTHNGRIVNGRIIFEDREKAENFLKALKSLFIPAVAGIR